MATRLPSQVYNILEDFFVTVSGLEITAARQRARAAVLLTQATSFSQHLFHFSLLCLRELRRDDDQAQIYHEERPNLPHNILNNKNMGMSITAPITLQLIINIIIIIIIDIV